MGLFLLPAPCLCTLVLSLKTLLFEDLEESAWLHPVTFGSAALYHLLQVLVIH